MNQVSTSTAQAPLASSVPEEPSAAGASSTGAEQRSAADDAKGYSHLAQGVLILDFGSQYTQLIARRIREQQVYCEIHPYHDAWTVLEELGRATASKPKAIVLSGGPSSVTEGSSPEVDARIFDLGLPVLGICYGMQLLTKTLGGAVEQAQEREFGPAEIVVKEAVGLFDAFSPGEKVQVWMSHGDRVTSLPTGFRVIAHTDSSPFAAIANESTRIYGLQFHPEVFHTPQGPEMLRAFLFNVAQCQADWTAANFIDEVVEGVSNKVGPSTKVVCGLSGGVDSSVAAVLVSRAIGDRLHCIFVDNGLLRKDEAESVMRMFRDSFHLNVTKIDARETFLEALRGITDPEQKRKTIGRIFIEVFEREAKRIRDVAFLVQGTLYPDVIESVSFKGPSAVIKSHHNVGGLPERMALKLIEPLRELFKDEVREVGRALEMPAQAIDRQPFPGPGLAIRCLGEITEARLHTLREADAILDEEVRRAGLYNDIWQSFCVLLPVKTVGVMGDERTYEEVIALRAVRSVDGMTADWARLPYELLATVSTRIINEVRGCNRVVYDVSSKPPGTIEWE